MSDPLDSNHDELQHRIDRVLMRVLRLHGALPKTAGDKVVAQRILKSGTYMAVSHRGSLKAKSNEIRCSRLDRTIDRLDELRYWLEFLAQTGIIQPRRLDGLRNEVTDLFDALTAQLKNLRPDQGE